MSGVLALWRGMTGTVLPFAGAAAPAGWLLCYGQAVSRADYPNLFAAIGTTFGAGDGATTFNVPDLRGRVAAGKDDMGGVAAARLTNAGTGNPGIDGSTLGAAGGADRLALSAAELPANVTDFFAEGAAATIARATENHTGTGQAHANAQPTIVLNSIIKT
jgi:microcystin-dependent protein